MTGGISRVDDMLYQQDIKKGIVSLVGKYVKIVPRYGPVITGIFTGEVRPREYTREDCLCIQVSEGILAYIRRDDISYIVVSETGFVTVESIPDSSVLFAE